MAPMALLLSVSLLFLVLLLASLGLARSRAQLRRELWVHGFVLALALPVVGLLPKRPLAPLALPQVAHIVAEALAPAGPVPSAAVGSRPQFVAQAGGLMPWLVGLWLCGAACVLGRVLLGQLGARRLGRGARRDTDGAWISARVAAPVVVGAFRPRILLPESALGWDAERRRVVLMHEAVHVRQRDGLVLLLGQLACALYWFHPLCWLGLARLRHECELAADEAVLASGLRASDYAAHLLDVARATRPPLGAVAMAESASSLGRRIERLVARDGLPRPVTRRDRVLVFGVSLALLAGMLITGPLSEGHASALESAAPRAGVAPRAQAIVDQEAARARANWQAERVAILALDPVSGAVLGVHDDDPGRPIVPASTLKPLLVALAIDARAISLEQRFDCGNGQRVYAAPGQEPRTLRDAGAYGMLNAAQILAFSSNIGASRIFDELGAERLIRGLRRVGIAPPSVIPEHTLEGAMIAFGQRIWVTPLALARAYAVLARDGLDLPSGGAASGDSARRVLAVETARQVRSMLEGVVSGPRGTGPLARVAGTRVAGKTGSAESPEPSASFVGMLPADEPKLVVLVVVNGARKTGSGGTIAAPLFARVARRLLGS